MYNGHIWQTTFKINCSKNLSLCSGSNVEVLQTQKCEHDNQSSSMPIFCGPHWLNDKRKFEQKLAFWKSLVTSSMLWRRGSLRTSLVENANMGEHQELQSATGWTENLSVVLGHHWLKLQKMQIKWFEKPRMFRVKEIWSTTGCTEERRVIGFHWLGKTQK